MLFLAFAWFPSIRFIQSRASFPLINWIHAMTFEIPAWLMCFLGHPFRMLRCRPMGRADGRPILLVHGYLQDAPNWSLMRRRLRDEGHGPIFTLNLGNPLSSIEEHAETVAKKVREIERVTGNREIALVGHSMGGLVSTWYAAKLAPPGRVTHVITLGSPLEGTHLAWIAPGKNGREMRRGSPFTKKISDALQELKGIGLLHIGTKTDQFVLPYRSSVPRSSPGQKHLIDNLGHASLLYSPYVSRTVSRFLKGQSIEA